MKGAQAIRYVLVVSFLFTILIANKLWFGDSRIIPTIGMWQDTIQLSTLMQNICSSSLVLGLLLSLSNKLCRYGIILSVLAFSILVIDDINRLQTYYYQYLAMLVCLSVLRKQGEENQASALYLILVGIYFHSGLTKLNTNFIHYVFPNMLYAFHYVSLESWQNSPWQFIAYSIPLGEMILAILILLPKTRKIGLYAALVLHLGILFSIGPWGLDWNPIVWIWNISMIALNWSLFSTLRDSYLSYKNILSLTVLVFFILMPFFNRLGLWDNSLSFSLYSGTSPNRQLHVSQFKPSQDIPLFYTEKDTFIDLNAWALQDICTAIYAENWVFDEVAKQMCEQLSCDTIIPFRVYKQSISYVDYDLNRK